MAAADEHKWWACARCSEYPVRDRGAVCTECLAEDENEAVREERETLLECGAYDDPEECEQCGAELSVQAGALVGEHWRFCPAARAHLKVVS